MNDEQLRTLYAGAMARMPLPEGAAPVPLEAMVDVLERRGSETERSETLRAILRDPRAREEFELLRAVVRAGAPSRPSWRSAVGWRIAAGVALLAGTTWLFSLTSEPSEPLRGNDSLVTTVQPGDGAALTAPPLFVWRRVPGAVDYRLEVVDSSGTVVFEERVTDTSATGPMTGELRAGQQYRWSVTALTGDGRSLRSPTHAFRLAAP
jgi:hypothetical protein